MNKPIVGFTHEYIANVPPSGHHHLSECFYICHSSLLFCTIHGYYLLLSLDVARFTSQFETFLSPKNNRKAGP